MEVVFHSKRILEYIVGTKTDTVRQLHLVLQNKMSLLSKPLTSSSEDDVESRKRDSPLAYVLTLVDSSCRSLVRLTQCSVDVWKILLWQFVMSAIDANRTVLQVIQLKNADEIGKTFNCNLR